MTEELISGAALIIVAIIEAISVMERRKEKKENQRAIRHAATREQESRLAMKMMDASLELGLATAAAMEQGKITVEMKAARIKAERAQMEYESFIQELAARQVNKI